MSDYKFILDIDGVFTDGKFYYTEHGKVMKEFGADDHDAIKLIRDDVDVIMLSGDWRGYNISSLRVRDMGYELHKVACNAERVKWMHEQFGKDLSHIIYMGDGFTDVMAFREVGYAICPNNASEYAKKYADYVCRCDGGNRAVAEAVFHIYSHFFNKSFEDVIGIPFQKKSFEVDDEQK